jgi:hypothetical protein
MLIKIPPCLPRAGSIEISDTNTQGELNRGAYVAPVTLTNSLRSLSFLEGRDCRQMAEMSGNKIPEEDETANDKRKGTNHSKVLEN